MNSHQLTLYDHEKRWKVILHDPEENKVVLYGKDGDVIVCDNDKTHKENVDKSNGTNDGKLCPLCHQRLPTNRGNEDFFESSSFRSKDYFLLLEQKNDDDIRKGGGNTPRGDEKSETLDPLSPEFLNSGYYKKFFIQEKKIGSGGFGAVFLAKHVLHGIDLGFYAVKKVPVGENRSWLLKVITEVKALESLRKHPNIVNYQHSWLEYGRVADFGPKIPCLFILMEYANGGSLADIIWNPRNRKGIPEDTMWTYFIDICEGLNYLHQCGIIHRDIKPHNVLINHSVAKHSGKKQTHLLISDFGTCQRDNDKPFKRTGATGTVEYVAPELLRQNDAGDYTENSDETSDIWSLGMILYAMAFSKLPFELANLEDCDREELAKEISRFQKVEFPDGHTRSTEVVNMIEALLRLNPKDRPSTVDILTCKFISDIINSKKGEQTEGNGRFKFTGNESPFTGITRIAKENGRLRTISAGNRKRTTSTELILRNPNISPPKVREGGVKIQTELESPSVIPPALNFMKKRSSSKNLVPSSPQLDWQNSAVILGHQFFQGLLFVSKIIFWLGKETSPISSHFYPCLILATFSLIFASIR